MKSSSFSAFTLLLRARRRVAIRRLRERAFELFVLGPLIIGAVAWVGERYLDLLRPAVLGWLDVPVSAVSTPALALAFLFAPMLWPGALRELFGHGPLDALPVPEPARLMVTLASSAGRALFPAVALLAALAVLVERRPSGLEAAWVVAGMVLFSWLAVVLASLLVHLRSASTGRLLLGVSLAALFAFGPVDGLRFLLLPWGVAGAALQAGLIGGADAALLGALAGTSLLVPLLAAAVHLAWRRDDLEHSQMGEVTEASGASLFSKIAMPAWLDGILGARFPAPLRALLRRDLLLVWRRFGPAVHLALGLALAWMTLVVIVAMDERLPLEPAWRLQGMIAGTTFAVLSTVALVPFLLQKQLPVFWLEKATGVPLEQVWTAKVWLSLLLALPAFSTGILLILTLGPSGWVERLLACSQLFLTSMVVSSLIGLACFEIATEPLIGTLWSGLVAVALASLFVLYPQGWWLWLIAYAWAASEVAKRASRRVRFTEVAT